MGLIEIDVDPLQLQGAVTFIVALFIEPMFITDDFPKLLRQIQGTDEITNYVYV